MISAILKGVAMFVALVICNVLMKVFGQPLIDAIPSGTWGLDWLAVTVRWLGTLDAIFWLLAVGVTLIAILVVRGRWLSLLSGMVVLVTCVAGAVGGVAYRLTHLGSPVSNLAVDPAFWILVAGVVAPLVLWAAKRGFEELLWVVEQRAERTRIRQPVTKPDSTSLTLVEAKGAGSHSAARGPRPAEKGAVIA